ncbi:MAG: hypothetical protein WC641_06460 [Patescibacteria group bacterium]
MFLPKKVTHFFSKAFRAAAEEEETAGLLELMEYANVLIYSFGLSMRGKSSP